MAIQRGCNEGSFIGPPDVGRVLTPARKNIGLQKCWGEGDGMVETQKAEVERSEVQTTQTFRASAIAYFPHYTSTVTTPAPSTSASIARHRNI
jgi:hypothetical protein